MPKKVRTEVPQRVADELLHANAHTCCKCREPRQPVEIHHINENPSDHRPENLAVLCRNCHGLASQTGPLGRRISAGEVKRAKGDWEAECERGGPDEPVESSHEEVLVKSGEHRADDWIYSLSAGDLLVIGVDSDVAVTAMIARQSDYRRWKNGEDVDLLALKENVFHCELEYEADDDNRYVFWLENDEDEDAVVEVDISIWSDEADDDE